LIEVAADDVESEAGTVEAPRVRPIRLAEQLEDHGRLIRSDADAGIGDAQQEEVVLTQRLDPDPAALGELEGVAD
jgi:hypothetical protein